jgi:hypothetical protein
MVASAAAAPGASLAVYDLPLAARGHGVCSAWFPASVSMRSVMWQGVQQAAESICDAQGCSALTVNIFCTV